jgi:glyoxylase I family protein
MLTIDHLHHVSLPVSDIERSRKFYAEVLGLREIERPPFDFPGAWFQLGPQTLHLIDHRSPTFRTGKPLDSRDVHFAIRVASYAAARKHLRALGFHPESADPLRALKESPQATAGFPQLYIMDPDRNVIELNASELDE